MKKLSDYEYHREPAGVIYCGDCLDILPLLEPNSIDLVLTDPPYGITSNDKDIKVDLFLIFKFDCGKIVFSQQPFTSEVIIKYRKFFKYEIIWDKVLTSGFLNANKMPLRRHENILVFGNVKYHPQKYLGMESHSKGSLNRISKNNNYGEYNLVDNVKELGALKFPTTIVSFEKPHPSKSRHRTEKPVKLLSYLIKTYSCKANIILDPFLGSGTTAVAAKQLGRKFIGIEISEKYCEIAKQRLAQEELF